jgi:homoserine O-succinyltransferase/O-acetyltransferase
MPVHLEPRGGPALRTTAKRPPEGGPPLIALVNNMPDGALSSTEAQFGGLLEAASGGRELRLRLTSFPELPRSAEGQAHIEASYWPIEELLAQGPAAVIVTGTEPRAARLADEPYWERFLGLLEYVEGRGITSIWSCLAAHAAVQALHGIERIRLPEKRCGVYAHSILAGHPLLASVSAPMCMPHSRWNELPPAALRANGYTLLSWSQETGADAFAREERALMLFFQGHPEYDGTTLLKEYRRDVGRYLNAHQSHYPTLPHGYLSEQAAASLGAFREQALARRAPELLADFPFARVAADLVNSWRSAAVAMYRNWLAHVEAAGAATRAPEPVSLARP